MNGRIILLTLLHFAFNSLAQPKQFLKVGNKVPDYTFLNLINYPDSSAKISDFKGKLLILDFWNSGCASCIATWSKLQKLQDEFDGRIQIILVNPQQDKTIVIPLIEKRKKLGFVDLRLPVVCGDSSILQFFAVKTVPHIVWIDKDGIVKSITYAESVNSKNIVAVLNNEEVSFRQKETEATPGISFDPVKPFFLADYGFNKNNVLCQSALVGYNKDLLSTGGCYVSQEVGYGMYATNTSVLEMYKLAYGDDIYLNHLKKLQVSRVVLDVKDSVKYTAEVNGETVLDYLYSYHLTTSRHSTIEDLQKIMQEDLRRYFKLKALWVKRPIKCLVITTNNEIEKNSADGKSFSRFNEVEFEVRHLTVGEMVRRLQISNCFASSPYLLINESSWEGKIGKIRLETQVCDPQKLAKALAPYGIILKLEERLQKVLVISEDLD